MTNKPLEDFKLPKIKRSFQPSKRFDFCKTLELAITFEQLKKTELTEKAVCLFEKYLLVI